MAFFSVVMKLSSESYGMCS